MSVGECIICTSFTRGFIRVLEMLLVCLWETVSFAHVLLGFLYAYLKCRLCVCGRMYHLHKFYGGFYTLNCNAACVSVGECIICTSFTVGFMRLLEMLLVCLWENVACARVFARVLYP